MAVRLRVSTMIVAASLGLGALFACSSSDEGSGSSPTGVALSIDYRLKAR